MALRPLALLALAAALATTSCFSTPMPPCAFLCGGGFDCPPGYICVAADDMCHLIVNGAAATCPESGNPPPDAPPIEMIDAPPEMIDAPPEMIDAPPEMIDAPPAMVDAAAGDAPRDAP